MKILNITHLLQAVRHKLNKPSYWTQGSYKEQNGKVCLMGACYEALGINAASIDDISDAQLDSSLSRKFRKIVVSTANKIKPVNSLYEDYEDYDEDDKWEDVESFNDHDSIHYRDVIHVLDAALAKVAPDRKLQIAKAAHKSMAAQAK